MTLFRLFTSKNAYWISENLLGRSDAEFEAVLADELLDACTGGSQAPIADFRSSWPSSGKGQTSGG